MAIYNATQSGSLYVSAGYACNGIIVNKNSGTDITIKFGVTAGGSEICEAITVGDTPLCINTLYAADLAEQWLIYYTITGTGASLYISVNELKIS